MIIDLSDTEIELLQNTMRIFIESAKCTATVLPNMTKEAEERLGIALSIQEKLKPLD